MKSESHVSLLELQQKIRNAVCDALPLPVWVSAEISELKVNSYSGHCYMELVEKGGPDSIPLARCSATLWRSRFGTVASYFKIETGSELAAGLKVLLKVTINYHQLYGLSLTVLDIDPAYTLGDWQQQKLQTIARLRDEGVFDMNRETLLAPDSLRIAVVSSNTAAGFQDFRKQMEASPYRFRIELFDAFVQGHGAEQSVISALGQIALRSEDFDAVAIIRGGGSQSDLSCFDSYRLCSHVAQFPLPVLTGIGHDKDTSVADMVAFRALKTPTAVAAFLIDRAAEQDARLDRMSESLKNAAGRILDTAARRERNAAMQLKILTSQLTRSLELRLQRLWSETVRLSQMSISARAASLQSAERSLRSSAELYIGRERQRMEIFEQKTAARRIENILSLGFAIVRDGSGALYDASRTSIGQSIDITLARGKLRAQITDNGKKQNIQ